MAPDGTVAFHDRRIAYSARKATFSFDLSDEFVREFAHGTANPYLKANFLAATFKRRTAMAAEVNSQHVRAARAELSRQLDALWDDTRYRRRERRRIVFLRWQELDKSSADGRSARRPSRHGFASACRAVRPTLTTTRSSTRILASAALNQRSILTASDGLPNGSFWK